MAWALPRRAAWGAAAVYAALLAAPAGAADPYDHPAIPTEEELREQDRLEAGGPPRTDRRDHQKRSVGEFAGKVDRASGWVKDRLSGFMVTPGRVGLGLGLVGLLWAWGKNRRVTRWAVLFYCSMLLSLGSAAVIFLYEI